MNWRQFFSDFRGKRLDEGHSEEQRYQAFKARFLHEMKREREKQAQKAEHVHEEAMEAAYGWHGQG